MEPPTYADRHEAAATLADALADVGLGADCFVLGLPRGGVPIAAVVADRLTCHWDVLVVRKISVPGRSELAMGAAAGFGDDIDVVRLDDVVRLAEIDDGVFEVLAAEQADEVRRRQAHLGAGVPTLPGGPVVIVDDGLATGATMQAAVTAVRRRAAGPVHVGVPVASRSALDAVRQLVDGVVCPLVPERFVAVGQAYGNFRPTTDTEVIRLLRSRG